MQPLVNLVSTLSEFQGNLSGRLGLNSIDELQTLKKSIDEYSEELQGYSLSPLPTSLGRLEDDYRAYRREELQCKEIIKTLTSLINDEITKSTDKSDYEKACEVYRSKLSSINNTITRYAFRGKDMLQKQQVEFDSLVKNCREQYKNSMEETLEDLNLSKISLSHVLYKLDSEQQRVEIENKQKLSPYITALERVNEQIDLEGLAIHSMNESIRYRDELARLHSLAQLGITVEIIGHELDGLDQELTYALTLLSESNLDNTQKYNLDLAWHSHNSLIDKLKFLSPLKLSGRKEIQKISGEDIFNYINMYFSKQFYNAGISFSCTKEFLALSITDLQSRLYPVFINIVNNSLYWVQREAGNKKEIILTYKNGDVFISDDGPGVDEDDLESLFTLFFTRKQKGGRGVGLYLCKQNLMAGGHSIRYETREDFKILSGANFAINFKGLTND